MCENQQDVNEELVYITGDCHAGFRKFSGKRFIDDKNRFPDRCDAFTHALECGRLPAAVRIRKAEQREN